MLRREYRERSGPAWVVYLLGARKVKELGIGRCLGPCCSVILAVQSPLGHFRDDLLAVSACQASSPGGSVEWQE